jgi:DNA-binding MarR family transcriptional regulator
MTREEASMADVPAPTEPDLGALMAQLIPKLIELEEPFLAEVGLSMWEYAIVSELAAGSAMAQVELSRRTRRDTTRLGRHLDDLEERGVVERERSTDQRRRSVRLTAQGRAAYERTKRAIRAAEDDRLRAVLGAGEAAEFRRMLILLARS